MNTHSPGSTRRGWLRFSLRFLLLGITAFAVGFPIWYRWPQEEIELHYPTAGNPPQPDKTQPPFLRVTKVWRRSWGSLEPEPIRRVEQHLYQNPPRTTVLNYKDGKRHGPYEELVGGKLWKSGQFEYGRPEGTWVEYPHVLQPSVRKATFTSRWHHGLLDGLHEAEYPDGEKSQVLFAAGRVVHDNGKKLTNDVVDRMRAEAVDEWIAKSLAEPMLTGMDLYETPLKDVVQYLQDHFNMAFFLDYHHVPDANLPLTRYEAGIDLRSALTLLLEPEGLTCDYRYGALWVTTLESAKGWHDPTGVATIFPPPGSPLAHEWNRILVHRVEAFQVPLTDVLRDLARQTGLPGAINSRPLAQPPYANEPLLVTASIAGQPLRHVLGTLLYNTNCRCRLEGETLVVLPSEQP